MTLTATVAVLTLPALAWWQQVLVVYCTPALLGLAGRNAGRTIMSRAVNTVVQPKITSNLISAALASIGIKGTNEFENVIQQVSGLGWETVVELPAGTTVAWVKPKREELASGLRRSAGTVWPDLHEAHAGMMTLFVSSSPLAKRKMAPYPYLRSGRVNLLDPSRSVTTGRARPFVIG